MTFAIDKLKACEKYKFNVIYYTYTYRSMTNNIPFQIFRLDEGYKCHSMLCLKFESLLLNLIFSNVLVKLIKIETQIDDKIVLVYYCFNYENQWTDWSRITLEVSMYYHVILFTNSLCVFLALLILFT